MTDAPKPRNASRLIAPIFLLVLLVPWYMYNQEIVLDQTQQFATQTIAVLKYGFGITIWLALAWFVIRLVDVFFWEGFLAAKLGTRVPRLLKDVFAVLVFFIAVTGIVATVFDQNVTEILALTGALGFVVGLALQSMISDVFQGIALNIDRPFRIGDWVRVHQRGIPPIIGCVQEVNWRSTRLKMTDNTLIVIPNHRIATLMLQNLSLPSERSRFELIFCLDFAVPHERALRILRAGALAAKGPLPNPPPKVRVNGVNNFGVEYKVRYWLLPKEMSPNKGRNAISSSILSHLHQAGLTLAYQKQDIFYAEMPPRHLSFKTDKKSLLSRIELFKDLDESELATLSDSVAQLSFNADDTIVKRGGNGTSMYILVEGLLNVFAPVSADGSEIKVAQITPGLFFGEMSLLTGEERSATVTCQTDAEVYEVTKENVEALLQKRPELAELLSRTVAERKMRNEQVGADLNNQEKEEQTQSLADQLLGKMKNFFKFLS